jgi:hypothetical protein
MPKYLIEVPHSKNTLACARVVQVFLSMGSHFLTNAEWGCTDGEHYAWMIVDVNNKEEARSIVPPAFRADARIVALNSWSMEEIAKIISMHEPRPSS